MRTQRIIKLTEQQLMETEGEAFSYLSGSDNPSYKGNSMVSVNGIKDEKNDGLPMTSDDLSDEIVPNTYNRFNRLYGQGKHLYDDPFDYNMDEANIKKNDIVNPTVLSGKDELDTLNDGNQNDDLTRIPISIEQKLDNLLAAMQQAEITGKQAAMLLNKMIEKINFSNIPYPWIKLLRSKIK